MFRFSKKAQIGSSIAGAAGQSSPAWGGAAASAAAGAGGMVAKGAAYGLGASIGMAKWIGALFFYCMIALLVHWIDITVYGFSFSWGRVMLHFMMVILTFAWFLFFTQPKPNAIHHLMICWILFGINLVLPMALELISNLVATNIPQYGAVAQIVFGIFNVWCMPIWLYWALFFQNYLREAILTKLLGAFIIITLLGIGPLFAMYEAGYFRDIGDDGIIAQNSLGRTAINKLITAWKSLPGFARQGYQDATTRTRDIWNQTVNPDFETEVEKTQDQDVGIKIERIEDTGGKHFIHHPLLLHSVIHAKTLDEPIPMSLACTADRTRNDLEVDAYGSVQNPNAVITSVQSVPFVCQFAPGQLEDRTYSIEFLATFPFTTSSYVRRYVIDESRYFSMTTQDIDPFEQYEITDKDPDPVYTQGPVRLGAKTLDPLIILPPNKQKPVHFQLKLENGPGWQGSINDIHYLNFMIPKGFKVAKKQNAPSELDCTTEVTVIGEEGCFCNIQDSRCVEDCARYNIYTVNVTGLMQPDDNGKMVFPEKMFLGCQLVAEPSTRFLAAKPLLPTSFRAMVHYNYTLRRRTSVSLYRLKGVDVPDMQDIQICGFEYQSDSAPTAGKDFDWESIEEHLEGIFCPEAVFGISQAYGSSLGRDDCIGEGDDMRCGSVQFTKSMYDQLSDEHRKEAGLPDWEGATEVERAESAEILAGLYIGHILKPLCQQAEYPAACLIGKYECGRTFVYGEQDSAKGFDYCQDTYIPQVLGHAIAYQVREGAS